MRLTCASDGSAYTCVCSAAVQRRNEKPRGRRTLKGAAICFCADFRGGKRKKKSPSCRRFDRVLFQRDVHARIDASVLAPRGAGVILRCTSNPQARARAMVTVAGSCLCACVSMSEVQTFTASESFQCIPSSRGSSRRLLAIPVPGSSASARSALHAPTDRGSDL